MRFVQNHQKKNQPFFSHFLFPVSCQQSPWLLGLSIDPAALWFYNIHNGIRGAFHPLIITCFPYILIRGNLHA